MADIRLRNINKEYILKRTQEVDTLEDEIADLEDIVSSPKRIRKIIVDELTEVKKKYAVPRRTEIVYDHMDEPVMTVEDETPDYPVHLFFSKEGYLKKITPQSLRMASEQKYKEGDGPCLQWEANNQDELLVFTDRQQCYKTRLSDFDDTKASVLGDYLPAKLGMDAGESVVFMVLPGDYSGGLLFFFENGKAARVEIKAYQTSSNRRKLTGAYSDKSPPEGDTPGGRGPGAGGLFHGAPVPDFPHRPAGPQDHPLHPGRGGDEPEAQIPPGGGEASGGDGDFQSEPLPGAGCPRRRGIAAAGGQ